MHLSPLLPCLVDEVRVADGTAAVVQECAGAVGTQPVFALLNLLFAERHFDGSIILGTCMFCKLQRFMTCYFMVEHDDLQAARKYDITSSYLIPESQMKPLFAGCCLVCEKK